MNRKIGSEFKVEFNPEIESLIDYINNINSRYSDKTLPRIVAKKLVNIIITYKFLLPYIEPDLRDQIQFITIDLKQNSYQKFYKQVEPIDSMEALTKILANTCLN